MEFAFKYGIWEFLIHDLTPETQLLAATGYGTDLNFLCITYISYLTENFCDLCFSESVCDAQVEMENALNLYATLPFKKYK